MIPNAVSVPLAVGLALALLAGGCVRSTPAPVEYHGVAMTKPPVARTTPAPRSGRAATTWSTLSSSKYRGNGAASRGGTRSTARSGQAGPPPGRAAPVASVNMAAVLAPPPAGDSLFPVPPRATAQAATGLAAAPLPATGASVRVSRGDTVYGIANRLGVSPASLIEANDLTPPYGLAVGQRLVVAGNRVHVVRAGESLSVVARRNGVSFAAMAHFNNIERPYRLRQGQRLFVPTDADRPARARTVNNRLTVKPAAPARARRTASLRGSAVKTPVSRPIAADPPPRSNSRFAWPVRGPVISGFGGKQSGLRNDGINIAVPSGTRVKAAENGVVAYAGNELPGFGNLLLIRHAGGFTTAYAHNQSLLVKAGEKVRRGQVVARTGNSGNVTKPQLHFEIRRNAKAVNPLKFMVPRQQARGPVRALKQEGS